MTPALVALIAAGLDRHDAGALLARCHKVSTGSYACLERLEKLGLLDYDSARLEGASGAWGSVAYEPTDLGRAVAVVLEADNA